MGLLMVFIPGLMCTGRIYEPKNSPQRPHGHDGTPGNVTGLLREFLA
jgi:hypothetical protein